MKRDKKGSLTRELAVILVGLVAVDDYVVLVYQYFLFGKILYAEQARIR